MHIQKKMARLVSMIINLDIKFIPVLEINKGKGMLLRSANIHTYIQKSRISWSILSFSLYLGLTKKLFNL